MDRLDHAELPLDGHVHRSKPRSRPQPAGSSVTIGGLVNGTRSGARVRLIQSLRTTRDRVSRMQGFGQRVQARFSEVWIDLWRVPAGTCPSRAAKSREVSVPVGLEGSRSEAGHRFARLCPPPVDAVGFGRDLCPVTFAIRRADSPRWTSDSRRRSGFRRHHDNAASTASLGLSRHRPPPRVVRSEP